MYYLLVTAACCGGIEGRKGKSRLNVSKKSLLEMPLKGNANVPTYVTWREQESNSIMI